MIYLWETRLTFTNSKTTKIFGVSWLLLYVKKTSDTIILLYVRIVDISLWFTARQALATLLDLFAQNTGRTSK